MQKEYKPAHAWSIRHGFVDTPDQLVKVKVVLLGHIRQGMKGIRGTAHAQQPNVP